MSLPIVFAFAALQALGAASPVDSFPDAYLDPGARSLVEQARERRDMVEGRIERYTVLSRSRVTVGLRALKRDRTLYRCESASRVDWVRGDTIKVELLGAREVLPLVSRDVKAGDDDCDGAAFDPTADRLSLALGGGMRMDDSSFLRHPLAAGSERDYRFRSGGSTAMRLADGTTIRLRELEILPRRSEPFLVSGSLWLEDRSHAVVRAVLRLARAFDYDRDFSRTPGADDDDDEVPRFLRPLTADIRYMTIEYGLWNQEWWLPRLIAFEGEAEVGRLLGVPLKVERSYGDYEVVAVQTGELVSRPQNPADSVCQGTGNRRRREGREEQVVVGSGGAAVEPEVHYGCHCSEGNCQVVITRAGVDSLALVHSEYLPESIYDEGEAFITEREMDELLSSVGNSRRPPWQVAPITWRTGLQGLDLVRYNRVEGLSVGASANLDLGRATINGSVRLGTADLAPNFELSASRGGAVAQHRFAAYRRLDAVGPGRRPFGIGSSLSALLFGRDDGDYYRSWGAELQRQPAGGRDGVHWRLYGELQRTAEKNTDFSIAGRLGDTNFRPNIEADEAEQVGIDLKMRQGRGIDPTGWRGTVSAGMHASAGTYQFVQPTLTISSALPVSKGLLAALELSGGTTLGETPAQSLFYLGGGSTVRGYGGNSAHGESFWTGRLEMATSTPGARVVLFSDAGWAGGRDAFTLDPALLSAGAGVSFLDGLVRMDVARALRNGSGWRVELQMDAGL